MSSFWEFPHCAKYDEIQEHKHAHLYHGALADKDTGISKIDRHTYTIYGKTEGLYMRPIGFIYRMGLDLLGAFLTLNE